MGSHIIFSDFVGMDSHYIFSNKTGYTGILGFFCLHQFPEEIDETQSTFGGKKGFILLFLHMISPPINSD